MKKLILTLLIPVVFLTNCSGKPIAEEESRAQKSDEVKPAPKDEDGNDVPPQSAAPSKPESTTQSQADLNADANQQASDLFRRFVSARKHHDFGVANQLAAEILSHNPGDIKVFTALTAMAIEQEKYDLARLLIDKILVKEPANAAAYNNLGVVELKTDNLRLALVQFKKAIEADAKNAAAHANLGAIYLKYRNYQNAAQELGAAVENGDQSPDTLSNLAFALSGTGDYSGSASHYEKALSRDNSNIPIMLNYAALLIEKTHKYKEGIKLLNKIRFIAHEPAILDKVEILLKKAENPGPTNSSQNGAKNLGAK